MIKVQSERRSGDINLVFFNSLFKKISLIVILNIKKVKKKTKEKTKTNKQLPIPLTIKNEYCPNQRTATPDLFDDSSWDMICLRFETRT